MTFEGRVIDWVIRIPTGRVATYGQIAALAGSPRAALMVGRILRARAGKLPWQRVISSTGRISIVNMNHPAEQQASLLRGEGIAVEERGQEFFVELKKYLWQPAQTE